jgi:D-glycero-D-manno-heptose 1,7-bisphosphate phosphatase
MGIGEVTQGGRKAVFFDRDGVLNRAIVRNGKPYPPSTLDELCIEQEAPAALDRLVLQGFVLIGVTNQPDVSRGTQTRRVVEMINDAIVNALPLEEIRVCYHDDGDHCQCRKPEPGLLLESSRIYNIDLSSSFVVGDRWKDVEAGKRAGCRSIWIDRGYRERQPDPNDAVIVTSLNEAVDYILNAHRVIGGKDAGHE